MIEIGKKKIERVTIAGLQTADTDPRLFEIDLNEMQMLCSTAGAEVVATITQKRIAPDPATYLGKGKLHEIHASMKETNSSTLALDAELTPSQVRNIEKIVEGKIIDRSQLILDIFAHHAKTNEARIQVELAQMRTLYPRLTHAWTHFSQQVGGIGTTGPGEKQLEIDRRLVQKRIDDLKARLKKIERSRETQSKARDSVFKVALAGYTNVGKSSILNALSGADVLVENKLFATLDTATRRAYIPHVGEVVISDTVGFLRKLPHHLVASFRSTLEVVKKADLLLVVMDASSDWAEQQLTTVNEVLTDLNAELVPRLVVFNKMDLVSDPFVRKKFEVAYPDAFFMSSRNPEDIEQLKELIGQWVQDHGREKRISEIINQKTKAHSKDYSPV